MFSVERSCFFDIPRQNLSKGNLVFIWCILCSWSHRKKLRSRESLYT